MNSKERVLAAIKHQEPDRVPVGEWGIDHDHVSRILGRHSYWRNRRDTTFALWEGRRDEIVESMKQDYAELVEKLDYDVVTVPLVPPRNAWQGPAPKQLDENTWEDKDGRIYQYAASNDSIQCMTSSEGKEALTDEDIQRTLARAAAPMDDSVFELVDYFGDRYGKERTVLFRDMDIYGILLAPFGGDYMHQMIVLAMAEDDLLAIQEAGVLHNRRLTEHCAKHHVTIMMQGTDFCMNTGPIMSPRLLRTVFFPMMKHINADIAKAGMHSFFHCCGNTTQILDDFVEAGYEGYQSIQVSSGLNNAAIKQKYGCRLTMWTGVQCETLIEGSAEDVQREVTEALETLMPGGGFIFGSTNSVQFGANTDNYRMALDMVREKGRY
ncbi:uroporphyrinogen III decarboxylase [Spirochaetia bacterium]|nr:uroporphyrinogen III decarboxylase [Spirochaetia bacterium]